jgi:dienelactone hydrolase
MLKVYLSWLDRWDEQRAQRGEFGKETTCFALDGDRAFPGMRIQSIGEFCECADHASQDPMLFAAQSSDYKGFAVDGDWVKFPSEIVTDVPENNVVSAKITKRGSPDKALVIFHHWNARSRNPQIANFLSRSGIAVVEIAMPYHFERSRPGSTHADYMLSANIGRTYEAMRQAVSDGRKLIAWLSAQGYREIYVLGMSLGSWVAGLIAANDPAVSKASLFLAGGSLADMVWTGRATRSIRASLASEIELSDLRRAWGAFNLGNHARQMARPNLDLQMILAKRDTVVLPALSASLLQNLAGLREHPKTVRLNCGHYSLGKLPYILVAGLALKRFLA